MRFRGDPRYQLSLQYATPDGGEVRKLDIPVNIYCAYATMVKGARKGVVVLGTSKAGETGGA